MSSDCQRTTWAPIVVSASSLVFRSYRFLCISGVVLFLIEAACFASERAVLEVRETAGIRRFGYPVAAELKLQPPVPPDTSFRLLHDDKLIAAQFRPLQHDGDRIATVALDFDGNFLPNESRQYVIEFGPDVPPGPEPDRGMSVEETGDSFLVSHGPNLVWTIPKNLSGMLRSVKTSKTDYMQPDSPGLVVHRMGQAPWRIGELEPNGVRMVGRAVKRGPIHCMLRFQSTGEPRSDRGISTTVELDFPRSKSWVRVKWIVEDPTRTVVGLGAELQLNIVGEPALVDFGASTLVYATLTRGHVASMQAGVTSGGDPRGARAPHRSWTVLRGPVGKMEPYVDGPRDRPEALAEGWAHVMDRERCTALAVDRFAVGSRDRIDVEASGRVEVRRNFADEGGTPPVGPKALTFWLHFVPMPPHVGAVTSPQSMQSPLEVTWKVGATTERDEGPKPVGEALAISDDDVVGKVAVLRAQAEASLAKTSGELRLGGLNDTVEVLRDRWGVPHIYAQNQHDLFFAQGFVQAQDRLWQLEIWRRTTEGRLAEIAGPDLFERDRLARLVRYRGDMNAEWTSYSPEARQIIEAFVSGVNAFIELSRDKPPIEFQLTGIKPEPWTPEVCIGRMAGFIMCRNASSEVLRAQLVRELGPEQAAKLLPIDPYHELEVPDGLNLDDIDHRIVAALNAASAPIRIPLKDDPTSSGTGVRSNRTGPSPARAEGDTSLPTAPSPLRGEGRGERSGIVVTDSLGAQSSNDEGSNNWTIAGRLTNTGKPILASDPHRPVVLPSLRYIVHLHCPPRGADRGWNVVGATEPALPGVALGHNDRIAWGITIVGTDQMDLYVEETDPDDPNCYRVGGEWLPMQLERESIRVRGEPQPREVELKFTRHGPVIFEDTARHRAYALRWTGSEPGTAGYLAALSVNRVQSWPEFLEAAARWKIPSLNLVYADTDGHIGWIAAGLAPVRRGWDGLLPVPGTMGRYEWSGFLAPPELPQRFDPPEGYIATANHNILPARYPHAISYEWAAPFRFQRIDEVFRSLIEAGRKLSVADSQALQHDVVSIPARRLQALLRDATERDHVTARAIDLLLRWDGALASDSPAASLYEVWQRKLVERLIKPRLTDSLWSRYASRLPLQTVLELLDRPDSSFGEDPQLGRKTLLLETLHEAAEELRIKFGPDPAGWQWGTLHQAHFRHVFAREAGRAADDESQTGDVEQARRAESRNHALAAILNLPSVPRSGDAFTPLAAGGPSFSSFDQTTGASYRHVMDLADWDRSVATSVPGQSGQPTSPHYGDLLPLWANAQYFPLLFSRAAIEASSPERLVLLPNTGVPNGSARKKGAQPDLQLD